jgi:hypothetical protein
MAGSKGSDAAWLIRVYLRAGHRRRPVVPVPMPGTRRIRAGWWSSVFG